MEQNVARAYIDKIVIPANAQTIALAFSGCLFEKMWHKAITCMVISLS